MYISQSQAQKGDMWQSPLMRGRIQPGIDE
jgi:hypothetical protein